MQTELVEAGCLRELRGILGSQNSHSVLLVHGQSYAQSEAADIIAESLSGLRHVSFLSPSAPYLDIAVAADCIALGRNSDVDCVLAIGGGRILDLAKLAAFGLAEGNSIEEFLDHNRHHSPPLPLIAIPTTAGSGSQATHFAVLFRDKVKYSLAHESLLPQAALVDANLLRTCPTSLMASSGLDALCQGIESYWSVRSTEGSRSLAKEAVELCLQSLLPAVHKPDSSALSSLARAAHLAGKAINLSFTTAAHACSYVLTSHYGVPHGHAVALLLAHLTVINAEMPEDESQNNDPRGLAFVQERQRELYELFGVSKAQDLRNRLLTLISELQLETDLASLQVDLPELLKEAKVLINEGRLGNNPRKLNWDLIRELYEATHLGSRPN